MFAVNSPMISSCLRTVRRLKILQGFRRGCFEMIKKSVGTTDATTYGMSTKYLVTCKAFTGPLGKEITRVFYKDRVVDQYGLESIVKGLSLKRTDATKIIDGKETDTYFNPRGMMTKAEGEWFVSPIILYAVKAQ